MKDQLIFGVTSKAGKERGIILTNEAGVPETIIKFRWIIDLNLKVRIIKVFYKVFRTISSPPWSKQTDKNGQVIIIKEQIDKLDFFKVHRFSSIAATVKKMKRQMIG